MSGSGHLEMPGLPTGGIIARPGKTGGNDGRRPGGHDARHHFYWRLDFDIVDAGNDQIFRFDDDLPDYGTGLGPGWRLLSREFSARNKPAHNTTWLVKDTQTGHGAYLSPGAGGNGANLFSRLDVGGRLYHQVEDYDWEGATLYTPAGTAAPDYELTGQNAETLDRKNVVLWYVAHVIHETPAQMVHDPSEWVGGGSLIQLRR